MKRTFFVMALIFVLFWPACSKSQHTESNAVVEIIDGIEYVHNTETPLHPEKTVAFAENLSIDGIDEDGNIFLFQPYLRAVDDSENMYVMEFRDQVIKVFDPDGKFIKTIGAKGRGPGEFQMISILAVTKDSKLIVADQYANRTSYFDASGRFIGSFKWRKGQTGIFLVKNSSYVIGERTNSGIRQFNFFIMKEIDFDGKEIRTYGEFAMEEPLIVRTESGTHYASLPDAPRSVFAGDQDRGLLYHCVNNRYTINVYNPSGKIFRKIDRPYEPVLFTDKDAEEYRAKYSNNDPFGVITKAVREMRMPEVKSIVTRMRVDDEGSLWICTNETKQDGDKILTAFDIFSPEGYYYARVWTAANPLIFKNGKAYSMVEDEVTGYRIIKRYKVVWN